MGYEEKAIAGKKPLWPLLNLSTLWEVVFYGNFEPG